MLVRRIALALAAVSLAGIASAQSNRLVIPAAGDLPGAGGTHFRSDISITNLRGDSDQIVMLTWLPRKGSGTPVSARTIVIPARGVIASDNFVAEYLGEHGLGSIMIDAIGSSVPAGPDAAGRLYATSRIWTPQPNAEGTVSQSLPAQPLQQIVHEHIRFTGHRVSPQFRTNLGIVNLLDDVAQRYRVTISGSVQTLDPVVLFVDVPPQSIEQLPIEWPEDPKLVVDVEVLPQTSGGVGTLWTAYLSTVDNLTGDSWSTLGVEIE
jgi:hypothetical protein